MAILRAACAGPENELEMNRIAAVVASTLLEAHWRVAGLGYGVANLRSHRREALSLVRGVNSGRHLLLTATEAIQLYEAARACRTLNGEVAEVGTFMGASARIITEALPDRTVHVCDTFEGLPHGEDIRDAGDFKGSYESVSQYLGDRRVALHRGLFPAETGAALADRRFAFIHLDVDLYDSTLGCLEFFWPRMVPGALLLSHDYPQIAGVVRAFADFFGSKSVPVVQLSGNQAMVVKF